MFDLIISHWTLDYFTGILTGIGLMLILIILWGYGRPKDKWKIN